MFSTTEPFLSAELAYRRERLTRDFQLVKPVRRRGGRTQVHPRRRLFARLAH